MITPRKKFFFDEKMLTKRKRDDEAHEQFSRRARIDGYMYAANGGAPLTDQQLSQKYKTLMEIDAFKLGYLSNCKCLMSQVIRNAEQQFFSLHEQTQSREIDDAKTLPLEESTDIPSPFAVLNYFRQKVKESEISFDYEDKDFSALDEAAFTVFDDTFIESDNNEYSTPRK